MIVMTETMQSGQTVTIRECGLQDTIKHFETRKKYLICQFHCGMVEVMDSDGKKWAWPDSTKVIFIKSA